MAAFTVSLKGGKELEARLKAIAKPKLMLRTIGLAGVQDAKALVPRRTGNLARSIRLGEVTDKGVSIKAGGREKVGYATFVEFGTRGGTIIRPVHAKALAWGGSRTLGGRLRKGASPTHFAKRVTRGSTRAQPYLVPGLRSGLARIGARAIAEAWNGAA